MLTLKFRKTRLNPQHKDDDQCGERGSQLRLALSHRTEFIPIPAPSRTAASARPNCHRPECTLRPAASGSP